MAQLQSASLLRPAHLRSAAPFSSQLAHTSRPQRRTGTVRTRAELDVLTSPQVVYSVQGVTESLQASDLQASGLSPELTGALGIGVIGVAIGALVWRANQSQGGMASGSESAARAVAGNAAPAKPQNAVLVFGSTGKLGRLVVKQLLASGRSVVAAARSEDKTAVFEELGLSEGSVPGRLFVRSGIDITDKSTLTAELLEGVIQIVSAVGPVFGRTPDGQMGYLDNMTSERVDAQGVSNVAELAKQLPRQELETATVLSMSSESDLEVWRQLDDTIMGGQSVSKLETAADGSGAVWTGDLIVEGGGFCGYRSDSRNLDLGRFDGIALRVRGDGQTYKLNLKTTDQLDVPESTYQAQFETVAGEWATVQLPWHEFVPVKRAQVDRTKPAIDPAVRQVGLVLSRFEFNGYANPNYKPGQFKLEIEGGIRAYTAAKPAVVMVSSAAVERNAVIGDDAEARKKDVPIVQLNPGGVLNHKYSGEGAVRVAGVPYTVVRAVGLTNEDEDVPFLLEASQGDSISGKISRGDVAQLVATALGTPSAAGKTFEARRGEARDARDRQMGSRELQRLFLGIAEDRHRARVGILPFPKAVPPPPPPSDERKQEILSDDRVQSAMKSGRGGRVRSEQETGAANSVTVVSENRTEASGGAEASSNGSGPSAKAWTDSWKSKQGGNGAVKAENGSSSEESTAEAAAAAAKERAAEAREWIAAWRSKK